MSAFQVRPVDEQDRAWMSWLLGEHWGDARVVSCGRVHQADLLPGFVALRDGERVGLVTYWVEQDGCEIVSLNSLVEGIGVGWALIQAVRECAVSAGCQRLWLVTSNDNTPALRYYQKRGFSLVAVHRNALEQSRRLKPQIPALGLDGIPLRDEIELEMGL